MSSTTSQPKDRSSKNNTKPVVVNTPPWAPGSLGYQGSPNVPSPLLPLSSVATDTASRKAYSLPLISGRGKSASVVRYLPAEATKKLERDKYTFINSKVTLKNPYGDVETYSGYFVAAEPTRKVSEREAARKLRGGGGGGDGKKKPSTQLPEPAYPSQWKWNLPPHQWSRPVYHGDLLDDGNDNWKPKPPPIDSYRRGRIWWKATPDVQVQDGQGNLTKARGNKLDRKFGFQFTWNPETFGTAVSVNMDITPSVTDRFIGVAGAFPATESISFNIRLDRTNDFACMANLVPRFVSTARANDRNTVIDPSTSIYLLDEFVKYYQGHGTWEDSPENIKKKIADLLDRGTIADLEFLYRAINGEGTSANQKWVNGRGIPTADIGFLMPTLLHIDIGPLSYDGYVQSLSVNHTAFTPEMIPIRTDVSISLNVLATVGLTTTDPVL